MTLVPVFVPLPAQGTLVDLVELNAPPRNCTTDVDSDDVVDEANKA
jgi:hypothetical protein